MSEPTHPPSDAAHRLPERPSLEQLRKQAKEFLKQLHRSDSAAIARLRNHKPDVS